MQPWPPCTPGSINQVVTHPVTLLASQSTGGHCPFPILLLGKGKGVGFVVQQALVLTATNSAHARGWHWHTAGHGSAARCAVPHRPSPCHHLPQLREAQENSASPPMAPCLHNCPCRGSSRSAPGADSAPDETGKPPEPPHERQESPEGLILLCTSAQSKGSPGPWRDLPRHGKVLSCSAPNQSTGRRFFSTSQALHKPKVPQELPLEPPPWQRSPGSKWEGWAGLGPHFC